MVLNKHWSDVFNELGSIKVLKQYLLSGTSLTNMLRVLIKLKQMLIGLWLKTFYLDFLVRSLDYSWMVQLHCKICTAAKFVLTITRYIALHIALDVALQIYSTNT